MPWPFRPRSLLGMKSTVRLPPRYPEEGVEGVAFVVEGHSCPIGLPVGRLWHRRRSARVCVHSVPDRQRSGFRHHAGPGVYDRLARRATGGPGRSQRQAWRRGRQPRGDHAAARGAGADLRRPARGEREPWLPLPGVCAGGAGCRRTGPRVALTGAAGAQGASARAKTRRTAGPVAPPNRPLHRRTVWRGGTSPAMRLGAEDAPAVREGWLGVSMASTARGPPRQRRREAPRFPDEAVNAPTGGGTRPPGAHPRAGPPHAGKGDRPWVLWPSRHRPSRTQPRKRGLQRALSPGAQVGEGGRYAAPAGGEARGRTPGPEAVGRQGVHAPNGTGGAQRCHPLAKGQRGAV